MTDLVLITYLVVVTIFLSPLILYPLISYLNMVKRHKDYDVYKVKLDDVNISYLYRRAIYFTVHFKTEDGKNKSINTKPMWQRFTLVGYPLEEYKNKQIHILYDRKRDRVIVWG